MLGVGWRGWGEGRIEEAEGKGMFFGVVGLGVGEDNVWVFFRAHCIECGGLTIWFHLFVTFAGKS